jgi:hypothetical protein
MKGRLGRLGIASLVVLIGASAAYSADFLVEGRRLLIKNHVPPNPSVNKIMVAARSSALALGGTGSTGDPTCAGAGGGGGQITFSSNTSGQSFTAPLPCRDWTATHGGYRYRDAQLVDGACKLIVVRGGRVFHATCLGRGSLPITYTLGEKQDPVDVTLELGTAPNRYCLSFGGSVKKDGSDGATFFARNASAPSSCPNPAATPTPVATPTPTAAVTPTPTPTPVETPTPTPPGSPSGAFLDGPFFP